VSARRRLRTLVLRPSAKINLTLRVGPRRADGFHDVRTLLQSVDLRTVVESTVDEAVPLIEAGRLQLHRRLGDRPAEVCGDKHRLAQVVNDDGLQRGHGVMLLANGTRYESASKHSFRVPDHK